MKELIDQIIALTPENLKELEDTVATMDPFKAGVFAGALSLVRDANKAGAERLIGPGVPKPLSDCW